VPGGVDEPFCVPSISLNDPVETSGGVQALPFLVGDETADLAVEQIFDRR
jgi:hypothetical protein